MPVKPGLIFFLFYLIQVNGWGNTLYVFDDSFKTGRIGESVGSDTGKSITIDPAWSTGAYAGTSCIKISAPGTEKWQGVYIQNSGTWKKENEGIDLSIYKYMVLSVKADKDLTINQLGLGESGEENQTERNIQVKTTWQRYVVELTFPRTNVNGLLFISFKGAGDIYLDEVFYAGEEFKMTSTDLLFRKSEPLDPDAYYLYADKLEHGIPSGYSGEKNGMSIKFNLESRQNPFKGSTCIQFTADDTEIWRQLQLQFSGSWSAQVLPTTQLPDLSQYKKLVFYARSDKNGVVIPEVNFGGGGGATDEEKVSISHLELSTKWKKFEINLGSASRERVNSLFMIVLPVGVVYLDEIKFVK